MSQSPGRCQHSSATQCHRRVRSIRSFDDNRGTPPPPTPSYRKILVGTLCFSVPTLLLSSWQSTHHWNFNVFPDAIFQAHGADRSITINNTFHFCTESHVSTAKQKMNHDYRSNDGSPRDSSLELFYQCAGPTYDEFASILQEFVFHQSRISDYSSQRLRRQRSVSSNKKCSSIRAESLPTSSFWGRRHSPLPDNTTILALGNSHLRQISKTLACQYSASSSALASIRFLPSLQSLLYDPTDLSDPHNSDGFVLEFDNGAQWISITNTVLVYSAQWKTLLEEFLLMDRLDDMTAIVLGKFTTYNEARHTNFERTMKMEQEAYTELQRRWQQQKLKEKFLTLERRTSHTAIDEDSDDLEDLLLVDFASIPPPDLVDIARVYRGPIVSVNMFSKSDELRAKQSYQIYQEECELGAGDNVNQNVYLVNGRRYIDHLHMECGSDDKTVLGTCHESEPLDTILSPSSSEGRPVPDSSALLSDSQATGRRHRDPSDMHRCAGDKGGHADLIAWDIIEGLHWIMTDTKSK
ncbi:hypothetical protein IV203_031091 [Nitzschia inconspicua]|uniref:Uncharacterized protein n=1 Tax=Nitzschia inconspicua TaxID=303405 RepID=A0A9K3LTP0_9STRA|nr:hypothetical protein IV203_031091 [Nitzschia inconspicua]